MTALTGSQSPAAWVTRMGAWGARSLTVVLALALVFTMVNVQTFAAANHPVGSFQWWIAWLLDPMASITLGTAIVFEGLLADYGRKVGWLTATKWYAGLCTWAMNIWVSVTSGTPSGVLLHSVAPGLVLLLAEAAPRVRGHLAEIIGDLGQPEPAPPVHTPIAVPDSNPVPQLHRQFSPPPVAAAPAEPAPQALPAFKAAAPRPPEPLETQLRGLIERTGRIPGRRTVAAELGISEHAARVLIDKQSSLNGALQ